MKLNIKNKKTIIICIVVLIVTIIIGLYFWKRNTSTIYIPPNPNLKISIEYLSAPSVIITYYFYDDTIIETSYRGGILSTGPVSSTSTTKYYFNNKIDLTNLKNFINKIPRDTSNNGLIEVTEKDGTTYYIDDLSITNEKSSGLSLAHGELLTEIMKITDNAVRKTEKEK